MFMIKIILLKLYFRREKYIYQDLFVDLGSVSESGVLPDPGTIKYRIRIMIRKSQHGLPLFKSNLA